MDPEEVNNLDIAYSIPYKYPEFDLHLKHTANGWWKDASKVYRLLDAFDKHNATIEQACDTANITRKQYKYFATLHPIIHQRRKISRIEKLEEAQSRLGSALVLGKPRSAERYLRFTDPEVFDRRYQGSYAKLRRQAGLPAKPKIRTDEEKRKDMEKAIEENRKLAERFRKN